MDKNKTTNPFVQTTKRCLTAARATFQNYESEFPDYEQRSFRLRLEVLNLECSDYERTQNPATKPKFAWAKNNHETTKLAGVQYAACPVIQNELRSRRKIVRKINKCQESSSKEFQPS